MKERVVEPSEITVESASQKKNTKRTLDTHPWRRFLARFFDYSLFFLVLLFSRKIFNGHLPLSHYEYFIPFEFFVWIPFEALFLAFLGKTPGKFFLRIQLRQGKRTKLDFSGALRRSFSVWLRGFGMGIPVLNLLCLLFAYHRLTQNKITSWDREDHIVVTESFVGKWRIYLACLITVFGHVYYYIEKSAELASR